MATATISASIRAAIKTLGFGAAPSLDYAADQAVSYLRGIRAYRPDQTGRVSFGGGNEGGPAAVWERMLAAEKIINEAVECGWTAQ